MVVCKSHQGWSNSRSDSSWDKASHPSSAFWTLPMLTAQTCSSAHRHAAFSTRVGRGCQTQSQHVTTCGSWQRGQTHHSTCQAAPPTIRRSCFTVCADVVHLPLTHWITASGLLLADADPPEALVVLAPCACNRKEDVPLVLDISSGWSKARVGGLGVRPQAGATH